MNHDPTGDNSTSGPQNYSSNRNCFSVDQLPGGDPFAKFLSNNEVGINSEDVQTEDLEKLNSEVVTLKEQLEVQSKVRPICAPNEMVLINILLNCLIFSEHYITEGESHVNIHASLQMNVM